MTHHQPIEQFLNSVVAEGEQVPGASFTLNPEKARAKFREFGLAEPHFYTGVLMSALLGGGATFLEVEADSDDFVVSCDVFVSREDLEQLFSLASQQQGSSHLFRLALGLQAALALDPKKVELACWNGQSGAVLSLGEEDFVVSKASFPDWNARIRSRLHVREKPGVRTVGRFLKKALAGQLTEEQAFLRKRFRLASVPITLNGEMVNPTSELDDGHVWVRVGPASSERPPFPRLSGEPFLNVVQEGFTAYLGFYSTGQPEKPRATLVVHGLEMPGWEFGYADRALVYCDTLTTDLSLTHVVQDDKLARLERRLKDAVRDVLPELFAGPLMEQSRFESVSGEHSYQELREHYERDGFLTVVTTEKSYQGPPYGDAPLLRAGGRFLDLLFPRQVVDNQIPQLVPPGRYRARRFSEAGPELALAYEPGPAPENETSPPRYVVHGQPEPTVKDVLALYETQPLPGLEEGLELLIFVLARRRGVARDLRALMDDPASPFGLDPESWLSRLVANLEFPTWDGPGASLESLVYGLHPGLCWPVFSRHPLRFHKPAAETVMVPSRHLKTLLDLVGITRLRLNREIRTGLINPRGEFVSEPDVVEVYGRVCCGRLRTCRDELWGYLDANGMPTIEPSFYHASDFEGGAAVVCPRENEYLLIGPDGERLAGPYQVILELHDGLRLACYGELWGYLNTRGEVALPFEFESGGHFGGGQALVTREGRRLVINTRGEVVSECPPEYEMVGPLRNGLRFTKHEGLFGYLDQEGRWAIEPLYEMGWESNGEVVPVQEPDGLWGLVNHQGEQVCPFVYSRMATRFSEGLLAVEKGGECGYLDSSGEMVLRGFQACGAFSQGLAPVQTKRWGYIDKTGAFVIPPTYLSADPFQEDRAVVRPFNL